MNAIKWNLRALYWTNRYVWPYYRRFVQHTLTPRCTGCGLSAKIAPLSNGRCADCLALARMVRPNAGQADHADRPDPAERSTFDAYLEQLQGQGRGKYDLLLFFSGGKDSTYLLKQLREDFPQLRILALTVDNGFRSPFAQHNSPQICRWFNVDHLELRPYAIFKQLYHYGFQHLSRRGFFYTDFWEGELFQDIGRTLATQLEIPAIALGYTPGQLETITQELQELDSYHLYDTGLAISRENQHFTRTTFLDLPLNTIFSSNEMRYWWDASRWEPQHIPTMLFPWVAWGYQKEAVQQEVQRLPMFGHAEAHPDLTNDLYVSLGLMLDYKHVGYCHIESEFADLVRNGQEDYHANRNIWEFYEYLALYSEWLIRHMPIWRSCLAELELTPTDILKG